MSASRLLDFFVLEAADYVDRLDALLSDSGDDRADADGVTAQARLLRGSATMARQSPIADLASAVERIGRAVRDGIVIWSPDLRAALIAAVDDLKILVRAVRSWGPGDDRRTESRIAELVTLYPQATKRHPTPPTNIRNASFIASETAQLATALDTLVTHPSTTDTLGVATYRLNALRGVAAINDMPPLAHVLASLEEVLRPLQLRDAMPETQHLAVLTSAVQLLRRFSQEIAIGGKLDPGSPLIGDFNTALSVLTRKTPAAGEEIIPIARLNYDDGQPQLVSQEAPAADGALHRFRFEVAGPCEHLLHEVDAARRASSEEALRGSASAVRASLRAVRSTAAGFGDDELVAFIDRLEPQSGRLDATRLSLIEEMSRTLLDNAASLDEMHARLEELRRTSEFTANLIRGFEPPDTSVSPSPSPKQPEAPSPARRETPPALEQGRAAAASEGEPRGAGTPEDEAPGSGGGDWFQTDEPYGARSLAGSALTDALQMGIVELSHLDEEPLSVPAALDEEEVVPIESLLYSGREALARAIELRDSIRASGSAGQSDEMNELFEMLDLAVNE